MTRYRNPLDTASDLIIAPGRQNATTVTRIGDLSEVGYKKSAFGIMLSLPSCRWLPVKAKSTKRLAASKVADVARVTRPLMRLVGCQFRYTVFECHNDNKRPRQRWGPKFDPLYGWLVNATGSANRLIRFTP